MTTPSYRDFTGTAAETMLFSGKTIKEAESALSTSNALVRIGGANTDSPTAALADLFGPVASTVTGEGFDAGPDAGRVTGDTVNTAARLQAAAEPNRVLVGELARQRTHSVRWSSKRKASALSRTPSA